MKKRRKNGCGMRVGGRKTTERAALAAVTLLAALLRLWALGGKTIWLDEAFSIWVADDALPEILRFVASVDHHPPLYYVLLHGWQARFGDSADAVRSLSALLSIITVPILYAAGKRLVGTPAALMAACVLALSPFHVRYAQEARMYALMTFFAAVALLCLAVYLTETRQGNMQRRTAMAGLAVAQALLMLSHNTAAFLFPAALNVGVLWAYWQVRNRKDAKDAKNEKQELPEQTASTAEDAEEKGGDEGENGVMFPVSAPGGGALRALRETGFLRGWAMVQGAALLLWLPWAPSFTAQAQTVYQGFWIQTPTLGSVWLAFHHFNLAFPQDGFAGALLWDLLFWGLALVGWRALNRRGSTGNLLGTLFLLPAAIELVFSVRRPIFYDRTLIWVTLPYYLLIGAGLWQGIAHSRRAIDAREKVRGRLGMVTSAGAALVLVGLSVYSLGVYYIGFEKEDLARRGGLRGRGSCAG